MIFVEFTVLEKSDGPPAVAKLQESKITINISNVVCFYPYENQKVIKNATILQLSTGATFLVCMPYKKITDLLNNLGTQAHV